jgi:hypothetical protein
MCKSLLDYGTLTISFTICLCISPDFDGLRFVYVMFVFSPDKEGYRNSAPGMFHGMFISPDLDGYRAPQMRHFNPAPICFTICLFISPDLDGHRKRQNTRCVEPRKVLSPLSCGAPHTAALRQIWCAPSTLGVAPACAALPSGSSDVGAGSE